MVNKTGEVTIWANGEYSGNNNVLKYEDIALKSEVQDQITGVSDTITIAVGDQLTFVNGILTEYIPFGD